MALAHGGRLRTAARRYGIPVAEWLDLSTGISPWSWPVPEVPESVWRRLPESDDGLDTVARQWAGAAAGVACLPVPGSQAAIQFLPRLRAAGRVGVVAPGYAEHAHCWRAAGHEVVAVTADTTATELDRLDVLVWIHPNNPTGEIVPRERLLAWHEQLVERGGWLVVDEAFVEASEAVSLVPDAGASGLIVLRSVGKFFGLAGIRGGFVFAAPALTERLAERLGPWAVPGPTRWILCQALADRAWQRRQRARLARQAHALDRCLTRAGLHPAGGTELFRYLPGSDTDGLFERLARQGILVRRFQSPRALRIGLPPDEAGLRRLAAGLAD